MTSVKASLVVTLKANDVVVAEVEDPALWQRVLTAINNGKSTLDPSARIPGAPGRSDSEECSAVNNGSGPLNQFAAQLGIDVAQIQGACAPSTDVPYMHLDLHCWEVMKKQLAKRGPFAISPIVAVATLLGLWFHKTGLGNPTQAQAHAVLETINVTDKNASRSIQNTSWLQGRSGGQIVLNPAEISKAVRLARCFCIKDWTEWKEPAK
jgi:hypothetical protein